MIKGIDSFRNWFKGYEDQYTIIGGTACDLLMENASLDFRPTKEDLLEDLKKYYKL